MRLTNQMAVNTFLRDMNLNSLALLKIQQALASGKEVNRPSDDPIRSALAIGYEYCGKKLDVSLRNMESARSFLSTAEGAFSDVVSALQDARSIAIQQASGTASADTRAAMAVAIDSTIDTILAAANLHFRNRYVFAGTSTSAAPYVKTPAGVLYTGNDDAIPIEISPASLLATSLPGTMVFGSLSERTGTSDLDPALYFGEVGGISTAANDLNSGTGVLDGSVRITFSGGRVEIDLSHLRNIDDVRQRIESATAGVVTVGYNATRDGICLTDTGGGPLMVEDLAGGMAALSLGIRGSAPAGVIDGSDLDPVIGRQTRLADLNGGAGVDTSGFTVVHGGTTYTVISAHLGGTVQDLINAFGAQGNTVFIQMSSDGMALELVGRTSGSPLDVATSGTTAGDLGFATGAITGTDLFSSLQALRDALAADDTAGIQAAVDDIDTSLDLLLAAQGRIGSRLDRIEDSMARAEDRKVTVAGLLSDTVDADLAELAVRFSERKTAAEAALRVASEILPLSLVDFL
ncbi:MAG: flagellar hook-associated protein FlgL [Planctomycetes bacterium]|nr:flagellar hook-associated protein FlgL [Planctomycetota bacterium]